MINFVICEDKYIVRKNNELLINEILFKTDFEYKIYSFSKYDESLCEIIKSKIGKKIYILDIELGEKSGIEIAREIRKYDWESIIIMATAHTELFPEVFKNKFMLFDFVSKFDNYRTNMTNTINKVLQIYKDDIPFTFNIRKTNYNVRYEELLYLQYDKSTRRTLVKSINQEYVVSKSMTSLSLELPDYFIKINNHCIINKKNLLSSNNKNELIFINGVVLNEKITNKEFEEYVLD